ncbi:ABC transporter permease [Pseudonocardia nigra]|uniref:ABC transporter permease n=1 Tax=Pseudonocardia nigra TaxID=1921578 RepID=UPI001C600050|nr:ABC transporter permease subunit [Pseudonocardia nigra]
MRRAVGPLLLGSGVLLPLAPLLLWAGTGQWRHPALLPQELSARGLQLVLDPAVREALATSAVIAGSVAALAAVIGCAAGRALGSYSFPGRRAVQFLLLAPAIVPTIAVTLGIQVFFLRYGLADTVAGVVLVHLVPTVPYVSLVMGAAFANLDPGLEEQARVLGAGPVRRLLLVTLPAVRPGLVVAAFFAFLISWSEYILTLLVGGGAVRTLPLLLFAAIGAADHTAAAALALVIALPPLVLVGLTARHLTGRTPAVIGFGRL